MLSLNAMSAAAMARKLGRPATRADLEALPAGEKGEIIDGQLYVQPRPRAPHAHAEAAIVNDIYAPYFLGQGGPGGWWILPEPGIESVDRRRSRPTWRAGVVKGFRRCRTMRGSTWFRIGSASSCRRRRAVTTSWSEVALHGEEERVRLPPFADVEIHLGSWWAEPPPV